MLMLCYAGHSHSVVELPRRLGKAEDEPCDLIRTWVQGNQQSNTRVTLPWNYHFSYTCITLVTGQYATVSSMQPCSIYHRQPVWSRLVPLNAAATRMGAYSGAAQAFKASPGRRAAPSSVQQFWQPQAPAAPACGLAKSFQGIYRGKRSPGSQLLHFCLTLGLAIHPGTQPGRPCCPQAPAAPCFGMTTLFHVFRVGAGVLGHGWITSCCVPRPSI